MLLKLSKIIEVVWYDINDFTYLEIIYFKNEYENKFNHQFLIQTKSNYKNYFLET